MPLAAGYLIEDKGQITSTINIGRRLVSEERE